MDILLTPWQRAIILEHKVAEVIHKQERHGWLLDVPLVNEHIKTLDGMIHELEEQIYAMVPNRKVVPDSSEILAPFKKDGTLKQRVLGYADGVKGPFTRCWWEKINLNSETQVKTYLLSVGWRPTEYNYNDKGEQTSPKLTEDSFEGMKDQAGQLICKRLMIVHRRRQLSGWLEILRPDGRVEAKVNTIRTNTGRMGQYGIVNVPKNKPYVFFGKQMREVWTVRKGYKLLGVDAKGLENRVLAHYMNDPRMNEIVLSKDGLHQVLFEIWQEFCPNIDNVKTMEYAFFFGARDDKLGWIALTHPSGVSDADIGTIIRSRIVSRLPNLDKLIDGVKRAAKRGYLLGLDGRKLWVRRGKSPLSLLIQAGGAVVMKQALVFLMDWIIEEKLDAEIVGTFHDEAQLEVKEEHVDRVSQICYDVFPKVTKHFDLKCPMEGDVKIGTRWSQTH